MKRFRSSIVVMAVVAMASAIAVVGTAFITALRHGAKWVSDMVLGRVDPAPAKTAAEPLPKLQLVRAVAYRLARIVRSEPIEVQPGYRLCPSI